MKALLKKGLVLLLGSGSALYLMNLGWGVAELVPDNLALVGNLDEAIAMLLLVYSAGYFGLGPLKRVRDETRTKEPAIREVESQRLTSPTPKG